MAKDRDIKQTPETSTPATQSISNPGKTPGPASTNPFTHEAAGATGGTGGVNPSDPATGTEAWGLVAREANATGKGQGRLGGESSAGRAERDEVPMSEKTFRCADAGNADCRWETSAGAEDELMASIERHGREVHGIENFAASTKRKFQDAIRERRAP